LLPLATRGEQGDHFPRIFWHHSAPLVACGASCLPFAKVGLFLTISMNDVDTIDWSKKVTVDQLKIS
jgi:hypothetical protein